MIKRLMSPDILMLMLLSSNICLGKAPMRPNKPEPQAPAIDPSIGTLSEEEINLMEQNPDKFYVYLNKDLVDCFRAMQMKEDAPEILVAMKEHIRHYKAADYDFACYAVEEALKYCRDSKHISTLMTYKADLDSGDAMLSIKRKGGSSGKNKCATFCRLVVRHGIRTGSLTVRRDAEIGGNLSVAHNVAIGGNLAVAGNEAIKGDLAVDGNETLAGNLTVNGNETLGGNETIAGNLTVAGTATLGATTIEGSNPVLDFAESVSVIRETFTMPSFSDFAVEATVSAPNGAATFAFSPAITGISRVSGAGFNNPSSAAITPKGQDVNSYINLYNNYTSPDLDYIYINFSFPLVFARPFITQPTVSVSPHNDQLSALGNLVSATTDASTPHAILQLIEAGASNVSTTGCTVNLLLAFGVDEFTSTCTGHPCTVTLNGVNSIISKVLSGMVFDVVAMGNYK